MTTCSKNKPDLDDVMLLTSPAIYVLEREGEIAKEWKNGAALLLKLISFDVVLITTNMLMFDTQHNSSSDSSEHIHRHNPTCPQITNQANHTTLPHLTYTQVRQYK